MITLFIIFIIIILIWGSKNDKKDHVKDKEEISKIPDYNLVAKPLSQFNKFLNLSYSDKNELNLFSFSKGIVTITMKSGHSISNHLSNLHVSFSKYSGYPLQVSIKDKNSKKKLEFYQMTSLFTDDEWELIFGTLTLAGSTYQADLFKYRKLNARIGMANSIIKFLSN